MAFVFFSSSYGISPDSGWARQGWVVVDMKGVPVLPSESRRDAYINLEVGENKNCWKWWLLPI